MRRQPGRLGDAVDGAAAAGGACRRRRLGLAAERVREDRPATCVLLAETSAINFF